MDLSTIRLFRKTLRRFERLFESQKKYACCFVGVTIAQCHALLEIGELGQTTTVDLSKSMGLDKSTLSRTIDGLVNIGLVERIPHPTDRRFTLLALTKQGKKICGEINVTNDAYYQSAFNAIPEEEHKNVIKYFGQLVQALEDYERSTQEAKGYLETEIGNKGEKP